MGEVPKLIDMRKLLVAIGFAKSKSEATRLIKQGAVKIYPPEAYPKCNTEKK